MKTITAEQFRSEKRNSTSNQSDNEAIDQAVLEILKQVMKNGDKALFHYTEKFDGVTLDEFVVSEQEFVEAREMVSSDFLTSIQQAKTNITTFHQAQVEHSWFMDKEPGIVLGQKVTPLEKVGIYIPGGKAAYPSSVLMNVIPAKLAGVENIQIVTPPQSDGTINPYVLVAAEESGVDTIYKLGGAQAIAALAYGTETVEKVAKIVGPGNAYVARAKKWVYGDVAIDMIAGPSEICVVADETAPISYIAADLLSQAEHDESATAICVTTSNTLAEKLTIEVEKQTASLDRKAIIQRSLSQNGKIIIANDLKDAFNIVNELAPEHLELMIQNPSESLQYIKNAGAIFLGNYSPEPLGDYFAGPNHTLPTSSTARFASPLGVYDFVKRSSVIQYSQAALLTNAEPIKTLANTEGLTAHANAIQIRKEKPDA
ncbi:histidinol dehydrogenase [Virgibacillus natechei]|uniref:Histidinol dehydrogenase n=1 Tax=Virgibacillus natechei TaxID=1216297 RepID=A0ABS4ID17_9BACI|nr:histidinol dehydrogenase [Virgibacillus natechei]MBP1968540.1 histidinol dehydrogenase [Virgibacillus natechei]UZD13655.1 histidinol dehydrogenase [Virgibacillus natechei]